MNEPLRARRLLGPYALMYLYRRRLRVHAVQELLAGAGVAVAVALVSATLIVSGAVAGSTAEVVRAVVGPASLQLRARGAQGLPEGLLARVEALPAVAQAAPLLEQTATLVSPGGRRRVTVDLAGADAALVTLDGLAHTLPIATLSPGGVGLSETSASALGLTAHVVVGVQVRGLDRPLRVSAVLGPEAFGALAHANVAVMPLAQLQQLAGLEGRISRIVVQARPGEQQAARRQLAALAGAGVAVAAADQDVSALRRALRPSDQASWLFATISALLGLLFAFTALLLTVPERRRAIADLRLIGTRRGAIVQLFMFQALCLGVVASLVGLAGGYALSRGVLHPSTGYLAEAFTLGTRTVVGAAPLVLALAGGVLVTCLACAVPLLDLRRAGALDAVYREAASPAGEDGAQGRLLGARARRGLALSAAGMVTGASTLFVLAPELALAACGLLALATVATVPLTFAAVLRGAHALAERRPRLTALPVALSSMRSTSLRSLALAATGALALFGSVALGGARGDLLRGIGGFARSYASDADVWVTTPGDNQATVDFRAGDDAARIARIPGVARVRAFAGGFVDVGERRVWIVARPPGGDRRVLESQLVAGGARQALARLEQPGWAVVSRQIASERHVAVGGTLVLPSASGPARLRVAALSTNLAWSPGAVFVSTAEYARRWGGATPTALGVTLAPGASVTVLRRAIARALGPGSGLQATSASALRGRIDALTSEGLGQLGEIATLLLVAAILALAAAATSAIWQRRVALAALRLSGVRPRRLRLILAIEAGLMLGAGCVTGALAGVYGQLVIDGYLAHVTGFPIARLGASARPLEVFVGVIAAVLALVAVPAWLASRVSPALALHE